LPKGGDTVADEKPLSVGEAAAYLGVNAKTVRSWADRGWVPSVRWPNGYRYFRREDLDELRQKLGMGQSPGKEKAA
jgi:excisionase family DNA binding protein